MLQSKKIQIITFNNPYPPNYGGVIDVFYKIEALYNLGYQIYLHIFHEDRPDIELIKKYCSQVYVYKRNTTFLNLITTIPFSVKSRYSKKLYDTLKNNDAPILFESIQTTYVLKKFSFTNKILIRTHNIEHEYYFGISKSESSLIKKFVLYLEALKLKKYQSILNKADVVVTLSNKDTNYYSNLGLSAEVSFVPVFHGNKQIANTIASQLKFGLYHGDLSISDNIESAIFICSVFKKLDYELVIASSVLPPQIKKITDTYPNIKFVSIKKEKVLDTLLATAHVNILVSMQESGTKLKVFNALYKGKHCVVNNNIVDDEQILKLCAVANTPSEFLVTLRKVFETTYQFTAQRAEILEAYKAQHIAEKLIAHI